MKIGECLNRINAAATWLRQHNDTKILIKQTKNLGDTLHMTPIARHYKTKYPKCKIAFIVGDKFAPVHELNGDFDKIFPIYYDLTPQVRVEMKKHIDRLSGLDFVLCPSIHPFQEFYKSHVWSHAVISHQYFANALIEPAKIMGGGRLKAPISNEDKSWVGDFVNNHGSKLLVIEYHSYSHPIPWRMQQFAGLIAKCSAMGIKCISIAGVNESPIPNTIDLSGLPWRRCIALLSRSKFMIGVGSGITMLAACAEPQPRIIELGVPESVNMKSCGYSNSSIAINKPTVDSVMKIIQNS